MNQSNTIAHLTVGGTLPNGWTILAYAVSDRHGYVLAHNNANEDRREFCSWAVSNNDLGSTAHGHYSTCRNSGFADWQNRVSRMYMVS